METPFEHTNIPIAIIGMACRLPGADDLDQYWQLLSSGGSAVAELPHERLDQELYYDPRKGQRNKSYAKLGAIISSRQFNRQACPISPELERGVDNAHLLMCETAAAACRHAGLDPFHLPLSNTGVYIGHAQGSNLAADMIYGTCVAEAAQFLRQVSGFQQLPAQEQEAIIAELVAAVQSQVPKLAADSPDVTINMVAGTISKAFRLSGPFMGVNSACASSLQSVLLAARALQLGRVDMAIVGGASDCKTDSLVLFSYAQSMSETGSRPFDADADGLICGEGYVALVLKTLPRALADGDPIQAVVLGMGMSCDGRGKSLWAPRKEGQVKAMERAYRNGLDMATLQYLEAHATSTNLGDATELNALGEILGAKFPPGKKIPITSVKANIGHALEAAGISSLIKTILCIQHRSFVPAINIQSLNAKIDWANAPFYIPQQAAPWPAQANGLPRRAAVNAFGIGGLNMHVVLEEFTEDRRAALASQYAAAAPGRSSTMAPSDPDAEAVAIVGMGCVFPGGANDPTKFWELVASGRDPKGTTPAGRWGTGAGASPKFLAADGTPAALGGYITDFDYDWRAHKVPPKQVQQADPLQFMLLEAADQALTNAGYDKKEFDRTRVGVLVGTEFGGDFSSQLELGLRLPHMGSILKQSFARRGVVPAISAEITAQFGDVLLKHWPALVDESGSFSTSTLASRITKTMNLMGGAAAIDSSDTSAAAVLATSVDFLVSGDCDMMICAAGQRRMNMPQYHTLDLAGGLASGASPRAPFDAAATGIVPGEGVGVLVLKRLRDARRDGDQIQAIIRGVGVGHAESTTEAMQLAMNRAFQIAGVAPGDVALVEMDGVGLPQKDQEQLAAVLAAYGSAQRSEPLLVSTITGQIGHTAGVSAMASLMKASFEVETGQMPATFGLKNPLDIVAKNAQAIQVATQPLSIRHTTRDGRRFAAVSSFGKGQAYHILVERGQKVPVSAPMPAPAAAKPQAAPVTVAPAAAAPLAPAADSRIFRLGAATPAELTAKIGQALSDASTAFVAAATSRFRPEDHSRLAIVAGNVESLARKLQLAEKQFANPDARLVLEQQGCVYRQLPVRRPRVAFVFPGQGSQYAGLLRELVRDVPAAAAAMREIDAVMTLRGYQTFGQMAWENPAQLGTDIWVTQIVMLLGDLIMHAAVTDLGIRPDLVTGHSYGEFAALTAADVWDREGVITAARARYEAIQATPTARGTLMATTAPPAMIEPLAATLADRPWIANYNAPDQTVIGGRADVLQQLSDLLAARGHKSQMLTVPCPFHTPIMEGVGAILARTLDSLRVRAPRVPVLSSVTNRYVAEPADIRANLAAQLTTPVRYVELISRIADEQETVFVEVGPQQALTRLNRRILEGRNIPGIIACDNPKNPGVEQLLQVRALLECVGVLSEQPTAQSAAAISIPQSAPTKPTKGTIAHFDATQRRTEKMRRMASEGGQKGRAAAPVAAPPAARTNGDTHTAQPAARNGNGPGHGVVPPSDRPVARPQSVATAAPRLSPPPAPVAASAPAPAPAPVAAASPSAPAKQTTTTSAPAPAELEKFLINFVVEQTGYPPEVVELDADLEADLGIDSIKKAQLFGELAEFFDVQSVENLTLDDFPTLRHVTNFLATATVKGDLSANGSIAAPPAAVAMPTTAVAPAPTAAPAAAAVAPAPQSAPANEPDPAELERFLINFVVEQTGYPPEVVELDADLEADLGIDSIKKAQLFGELAEFFDVQSVENLTLDDFPTLRHVTRFLATATVKGDLSSNGSVATAPAPAPVASAPTVSAPAAFAPAPVIAPAPVAPAPSAPPVGAPDPAELERFLINFVVEQTGYPPEVVELDADLEADLGIDSIKKAQLFGELAEFFDVQSVENLTLDDFPTLRHVVDFLQGNALKKNLIPSQIDGRAAVAEPASPVAPPKDGVGHAPAVSASVAVVERPQVDQPGVLQLAGSSYEMGVAHGRQKKREIQRILRRYADLADAEELPLAVGTADPASHFTAAELDELRGIADAVGVPLANILAHNLAIYCDFGTATLHRAVAGQREGVASLVHSSSQQLPLVGALADCLRTVVQVRSPSVGIPHAIVSIVGTVGGLGGVNACGLAVTVAALDGASGRAASTRGRSHAGIAEQVLANADSIDSAVELLGRFRGSSWNACLTDRRTGRISYVESNGQSLEMRDAAKGLTASNRGLLDSAPSSTDSASARVDITIDQFGGTLEVGQFTSDADQPESQGRYSLRELMPQAELNFVVAPVAPVAAPEPTTPKYDLPDDENDDTHRFFMRELELPFDRPVPAMPAWNGAALIVGDNPLADALKALIESSGTIVRQLPISEDLDETLAGLDRIWTEQPTPHVFIVTPRDLDAGDRADEAVWRRRWYRVAVLPYFVCQRWTQLAGQANLLDRSTVVSVTSLGGDFGFSGAIAAPESGALTGLMKTMHIEVGFLRNNRNMRAKAIDAPIDEPPQSLAASICRELASGEVDYEVAYIAGKRHVQCAYAEKAPVRPHAEVRPGGTWVVSGGSRGITAECALELGRRFGAKLHLIGTSPLPRIDASMRNLSVEDLKTLKTRIMREARAAGGNMDAEWARVEKSIEIDQSLRAFAAAGVDVTYHVCDVADAGALATVLDAVRRQSGPIEGILHGAGIERPASFERKTRAMVMATLGAKVDGAVNLMRLTRNDPVRWFIGFGSVSGRLGSNGQTDYGLASDMLCKLAAWYKTQRPEVHSVGFHWHPWGEVGMAARRENTAILRMGNAPANMAKREGINHFVRELYAGAPTPEVLITSWEYHGRYYGTANHPRPAGDQRSEPTPQSPVSNDVGVQATPVEPWAPLPFEPVASRRELKMLAAPLPPNINTKVNWQGPALILGNNPDALALRDRLLADGATVHMVPVSNNPREVAAAIEAVYATQPPRYMFLMTARDPLTRPLLERDGWQERRALGVVGPYLGVQHWFRLRGKAKDTTPVTIVAATSLGGDFGITHHIGSPEGGALAGMLKSIYIEDSRLASREVRVKVVDAPADEQPAAVAEAIYREVAADDPNLEIGWSRGQRSVLRSEIVPVESLPKQSVPRGGTWVVTGGARGITAATALELGKRFGLKLHLIGRSAAPAADAEWRGCNEQQLAEIKARVVRRAISEGRSPEKDWDAIKFDIEIHESLQKLAAAGVQATYHSCDLADWDQLAGVLAEIRRQDGPIQGIVHGAGWGRSGRFSARSADQVERSLAGKLDGAVALMSLTRQDPLRYFIGFGSIGGRYGGNGLSDYATANDMFAKLCQWFRVQRPDCKVCCMDWQSWDQIGMAMLGDNAMGSKGRLKMVFISPAEGVEHLCRELQAGLPTSEVVITDGHFERTFYPFVAQAESAATATSDSAIDRLPLVETIVPSEGGGSVAEVHFEPTRDPFLIDHQFRGKPLLPAVIALEAIAETARLQSGKAVAAIHNVELVEGLFFHTERTLVARVRAAAELDGTIACDLVSDFRNRADKILKKDKVHVRAVVEVTDGRAALDIPFGETATTWHPYEFKRDGPLVHGRTLQGVKAVMYEGRAGWGQLSSLSLVNLGGARPGHDWIVPATLLDAGFYVCGIHAWLNAGEAFSLPASIEAVRFGRMPRENENCLLACVCRELEPKQAIYDFTVFGDDRQAILSVTGHRLVMVRS